MRMIPGMALVALLGATLSACEGEQQEQVPPHGIEEDGGTAVSPADSVGAEGGARLSVDSLDGEGEYLTDGEGRAVYAIEGAPEGESVCHDACAEEWPPLLAAGGDPAAAAAVRAELIGTIDRGDGELQVTYAGRALYYYHGDDGPGRTTGQEVTDQWGEWYLVRPDGGLFEGHESGRGSGRESGDRSGGGS